MYCMRFWQARIFMLDACPQSRLIWGEDVKLWTTFIYLPCCEHSLLINLSCPKKCNYKNWWWTKKTKILQFLASNLLTVLTCQRKNSSFLNMHIFKIKKKEFQCLFYTQEVTLEVNRNKFVDLFFIYIACYPYSNFSLSEELQVNENSTVHFSKSTRFLFFYFIFFKVKNGLERLTTLFQLIVLLPWVSDVRRFEGTKIPAACLCKYNDETSQTVNSDDARFQPLGWKLHVLSVCGGLAWQYPKVSIKI